MKSDNRTVHNPGTLPDHTWNYLALANTTVIFEDTFASFISAPKFAALKAFHTLTNSSTSAFSIMLHSLGDVPEELVTWAVEQIRGMAGWGYVTEVVESGEWWHRFPAILDVWVTRYAELARTEGDGGGAV